MQHTTKYKFNLIETSDTFSPDALNTNAQAVEDALVTHEAAVDSALKSQKLEWQAADTALSQTVTANKSALEATVAANKSAADAALSQHAAQIAQCQADACFFKLAGPVSTTAANQAISISLSGIDLNQYRMLFMVMEAGDGNVFTLSFTLNGSYGMQLVPSTVSSYAMTAKIFPAGSKVNVKTDSVYISNTGSSGSLNYNGSYAVSWTALKTLAFSGNYPAGLTMTLYGIKR